MPSVVALHPGWDVEAGSELLEREFAGVEVAHLMYFESTYVG